MKFLQILFLLVATFALISAAPWESREDEIQARQFAQGLHSLESLSDDELYSFWKKVKKVASKVGHEVVKDAKVVAKVAGPIVKEAAKEAIAAKAGAIVVGALG